MRNKPSHRSVNSLNDAWKATFGFSAVNNASKAFQSSFEGMNLISDMAFETHPTVFAGSNRVRT